MPNFFYYDANGRKHGMVNAQQLRELAVQGTITPATLLETDTGQRGQAGQIKGLFPPVASLSQSVDVPVASESKSSLVVTLIGVLVVLVVGGIGWTIVSSNAPSSLPPVEQVVVNRPVVERPAAPPPKANTSEVVSAEKLRRQVEHVSQYDDNGIAHTGTMLLKWSDQDLDEIVRWLLRTQEAGVQLQAHAAVMWSFLTKIRDEEIEFIKNDTWKGTVQIDQYICNRAHVKYASRHNADVKVLENMLPESNRLSGNRYDEVEKARLAQQDLFK